MFEEFSEGYFGSDEETFAFLRKNISDEDGRIIAYWDASEEDRFDLNRDLHEEVSTYRAYRDPHTEGVGFGFGWRDVMGGLRCQALRRNRPSEPVRLPHLKGMPVNVITFAILLKIFILICADVGAIAVKFECVNRVLFRQHC